MSMPGGVRGGDREESPYSIGFHHDRQWATQSIGLGSTVYDPVLSPGAFPACSSSIKRLLHAGGSARRLNVPCQNADALLGSACVCSCSSVG
jgi:hypothetical protein